MPAYICLEAVTVEMVKQQIEKLHCPGLPEKGRLKAEG
jgi:hypothetical protein